MSSTKTARRTWFVSSLFSAAAIFGAVIVSAAGASADSSSGAVDSVTAFADLNAAVSAMKTSYARAHSSDPSPASIANAVTDLTSKWVSSGRRCPDDYSQTLDNDAQQIMAAITQTDPAEAAKILSAVNDDLSSKDAHAKAVGSLTDPVADVALTVKTGQVDIP
ncbi:MAG TPA: hypothetical protein VII69_03265 [Candidatus Eremiobacteraceae bacterium]